MRIAIVYCPIPSQTYTITAANIGEFYTTILDIDGPKTFCWSVPYLSDKPYLNCGDPRLDGSGANSPDWLYNGKIKIILINPLRSLVGDSTATVNCNIFSACGPSMTFSCLREPYCYPNKAYNFTYPTRALAEGGEEFASREEDVIIKEIRVLFRKRFAPLNEACDIIVDNEYMPDHIHSWTEVFSRPMIFKTQFFEKSAPTSKLEWYDFDGDSSSLRWLPAIFCGFKGSFRYKFVVITFAAFDDGETVQNCNYKIVARANYGVERDFNPWTSDNSLDYCDSLVRGSLDVQAPYYEAFNFYTMCNQTDYSVGSNGVLFQMVTESLDDWNSLVMVFKSVGEDFSFMDPVSLPQTTIKTWSS